MLNRSRQRKHLQSLNKPNRYLGTVHTLCTKLNTITYQFSTFLTQVQYVLLCILNHPKQQIPGFIIFQVPFNYNIIMGYLSLSMCHLYCTFVCFRSI